MKTVLIVDTETTGVDRENDHVIELGYVLWSVEHQTILETFSGLLPCATNPAEAVNGIPVAALPLDGFAETWATLRRAAARAGALVAHQADFDRDFCVKHAPTLGGLPWICTREDMVWPRAGTGTSLTETALAHGVAVVAAHRAINDCLTLVRLFEAVPDIAERLEAARQHALLPKARLVALAPYEERETVKKHGFRWHPERKEWARTMCLKDACALPFKTRVVEL